MSNFSQECTIKMGVESEANKTMQLLAEKVLSGFFRSEQPISPIFPLYIFPTTYSNGTYGRMKTIYDTLHLNSCKIARIVFVFTHSG